MIKLAAKIEVKVGERLYHFLCDNESPLGEIHDVICQMKGLVISKMQEIQEAQKPKVEEKDGVQQHASSPN